MKRTLTLLIFLIALLAPAPKAQEGGGGALLFLAGGVLLGENLLSTTAVKLAGDEAGYPAGFLPMFGYGLIGMVSAMYLSPSGSNLLVPMIAGSLAGNAYYLYRTHSERRVSLSLGTHSLGLGPEGTALGLRLGLGGFRLGAYRGDIGDKSVPGPNFAGKDLDFAEREAGSIYAVDLQYRRAVYGRLELVGGGGATRATTHYASYSHPDPADNFDRDLRFTNYFLTGGIGYLFFKRLEVDAQAGWMLLRDREREAILSGFGSDYVKDNPLQANLKFGLRI
ncbi:MAG: hypothetical protein JWP91_1923 [Fibrobacteres bacterium]|nr:hypothetical protein [Fibrobacterota bacterium]